MDCIVCHFMPSNTENDAIFCGSILLLMVRANEPSLLITVNSADPPE